MNQINLYGSSMYFKSFIAFSGVFLGHLDIALPFKESNFSRSLSKKSKNVWTMSVSQNEGGLHSLVGEFVNPGGLNPRSVT